MKYVFYFIIKSRFLFLYLFFITHKTIKLSVFFFYNYCYSGTITEEDKNLTPKIFKYFN